MKPWRELARARTKDGTELVLSQRDEELVIHVDGAWLMSSRCHGSEEAMAEAAGLSPARGAVHVLVGGLGFGYTLAATLASLGPAARVTVAEISEATVDWVRGIAAGLAGRPLDDPRVVVKVEDVLAVVRSAAGAYDAILLDVDNGPWALTVSTNSGLYDAAGLASLARALKPAGTLVVWSAGPAPAFSARMRKAGFVVTEREVAARGGRRGSRHTLFIGRRG